MPYPNEHAARLKSPDMEHIRVRRTKGSGKGTVQGVKVPTSISVIWYIVKRDDEEVPVPQALRFPIKTWTAPEARKWLKDKGIKYILFEKATGKKGKQMRLEFKSGLTYSEANRQLSSQVRKKLDISGDSKDEWAYIREFYINPKEGIAEHYVQKSRDSTLYKFSYKLVGKDEIEIVGEMEEVEETFVPVGKTAVKFSRSGSLIVTGEKGDEMGEKAKAKTEEEDVLSDGHIPEIDKDARRISTPRDGADLIAKALLGKAKSKDPGWVQGHAAHWDNVDLGGEIMRKGSFEKSINERVAAGKVKLMVKHFAYGGDVLECIGTITEAKEDSTGLWFNAKFSSVGTAQKVRTLIIEGHVDTCSVGYMPVKWNWLTVPAGNDDGKTVRVLEHLECKFYEVTITVVPMNEKAKLTAAKSLTEVASKVQDIAKELGVSDTDAPSDEQKAAILDGAFGGEAEAKALKESLTSLSGELDRLLVKSEPKGTSSKRNEAVLRQRKLDIEKNRLALEGLES